MNRINILLKQNRKLFHTRDLELLWQISNKKTLYSALGRSVKKGVLIPIYRGFYSVIPSDQLDPVEIGIAALHQYSYLSTETILAKNGIIFQRLEHLTFCSTKNRLIKIGNQSYLSRQLADKYLFHTSGIVNNGQYSEATANRAIADMLYFNPRYHFDNEAAIDWNQVTQIRREIGYL
jgi:predicted transcriptional regulator of viral defense system